MFSSSHIQCRVNGITWLLVEQSHQNNFQIQRQIGYLKECGMIFLPSQLYTTSQT